MDRFVGKRLDGRYEIREIIGVGGMAVVYKAYDSIEDRIVAIKILKEEFASNEEFQRRFKNESKAIAVLSHPNIVKVYDVSFGDLIQYIVMEYIEGITLKEYIERTGNLSWNDAVSFAIQILRGLQHAHDKGIVHRDVKPQNIIVLADRTIKVTDFGIARFARNESQTITDKAIGSVHYISPEQAKGELTDEKADIYSLGVIMYEMLTGSLPFEAESAVSVAIMQLQTEPKLPTHINPLIPLGLEQITMRAMQKDVRNRYKSAAEMLRDLEQFKRDPSMVFQNNYFVDDSPTKHIDNFYYDAASTENTDENDDAETTKVPLIPILTGVAVAFIAAIVVLCIIFIPKLLGSTGDEFPCPDFVGMEYEKLVAKDNEYGFKFVPEYDNNTDQPEGVIFEQTPAADRKVKRGATITVKVSIGVKSVRVPIVAGYEATKAKAALENEGFTVVVVQEASEDVANSFVIRTEPAGGSNMPAKTEVKMFVSTGVPEEYVPVPNVTRCTLEDAKRQIEAAGFTVGTVKEVNSEPHLKGYVISQDPTSGNGKTAGKGSAINLSVGSGVTVYKFKLTVALPDDYIGQYGTVSAWINNKMVEESKKMDIRASKDTSFDITTESKVVKIVIKLSSEDSPNEFDDYVTYYVDATTGTIDNDNTIIHGYPDNTQIIEPSSQPDSGDSAVQ